MDELTKRRLFALQCARFFSSSSRQLQVAREISFAIEGWLSAGVPQAVVEAALIPACSDVGQVGAAIAAARKTINFLLAGEVDPSAAGGL